MTQSAASVKQIDGQNTEFWNTLCGSHLAKQLGVVDDTPPSLKRFDDWYYDFYPYLFTQLSPKKPFDTAYLEDCSLKSDLQYPMSQWLDLSHVRDDVLHGQELFKGRSCAVDLRVEGPEGVIGSISSSSLPLPSEIGVNRHNATGETPWFARLPGQLQKLSCGVRLQASAAVRALKLAVPLKIKQAIKDAIKGKS